MTSVPSPTSVPGGALPSPAPGRFPPAFRGLAIGLAGVTVVGLLDWWSGLEISISVLYLAPIAAAVWLSGRGVGILIAILSACTWFLVEQFLEQHYSRPWISYWNAGARLGFFLTVAVLLDRVRILNTRLGVLLAERTEELREETAQRKEAERELADINQREQERIACELHDHLGAHLAGVAFRSKAITQRLEHLDLPEAGDAREVTRLVNQSIDQVRSLARLLSASGYPMESLPSTLSRLGAELEALYGVTCLVEIPKDLPALSAIQNRELHRIAQEATRNAIQHGRAQLLVLAAYVEDRQLHLSIASDGQPWRPADPAPTGMGTRIMRHRAGTLGGSLAFEPGHLGGTSVRCRIPLQSPQS